MKRIIAYEYDKRNREAIVSAVTEENSQIISWSLFAQESDRISFPPGTKCIYVEISSMFANEDRAELSIAFIEKIISFIIKATKFRMYLIVERQYSQMLKNLVYYRISDVSSLETLLGVEKCVPRNIIDISREEFESVLSTVNENLFGNDDFKTLLRSELEKFRIFNRTGTHPVFSVLLCGNAGIGKTELARLLHRALAPDEPMIKLNFGNYSSDNALNSLIGSPRGYIGSNKGELSEKLSLSRSTVVLIDEFEKANKPVYNFFLQLLEDGQFTDSLGRDYSLDKYILIFTSNIDYDRIEEILSPELRSRFDIIRKMLPLSTDEKQAYVSYKVDRLIDMMQDEVRESLSEEAIAHIKDIDVIPYSDMRKLNSRLMQNIADEIYPILYGNTPEATDSPVTLE